VRTVVHPPRRENRQRRDDGGEQHHEQAKSVHAEEILDAERRHPVEFFDELQSAGFGIEMQPQAQSAAEADKAGGQREAATEIFRSAPRPATTMPPRNGTSVKIVSQ